jgi:hypothetical protein
VTPFQVNLCGHATLASAHFLFTSVLAEHEALIEFSTKSGILTAKKVPAPESTGVSGEGKLFIELDFPMIDLVDCHPSELPFIPETLNGASIVSVHKSTTAGDLIVVLLILILFSCLKCLDFLMLLMKCLDFSNATDVGACLLPSNAL